MSLTDYDILWAKFESARDMTELLEKEFEIATAAINMLTTRRMEIGDELHHMREEVGRYRQKINEYKSP